MKGWLQTLGLTALLASSVLANEVELVSRRASGPAWHTISQDANDHFLQKSDEAHRQRCSGMYSRKAWGGNVDPFILVKFSKAQTEEGDPLASLVIFEWNDEELIGEYRSGESDVSVLKHTNCSLEPPQD